MCVVKSKAPLLYLACSFVPPLRLNKTLIMVPKPSAEIIPAFALDICNEFFFAGIICTKNEAYKLCTERQCCSSVRRTTELS
jgi:hypothetical protein